MKKPLFHLVLILTVALLGGAAYAADLDGDGVEDEADNCPLVANPSQIDSNFNMIGEACEGDWDDDGVADAVDNCWDLPNPDQTDLEGDDVGDLCDIDRDGDGLTNNFELNILHTSPDNWDTDGDNVSDYFDCNKLDPSAGISSDCSTIQVVQNPPIGPTISPDVSNPFGDDDGDGVLNGNDNCPDAFNPGQQDQDEDGIGDQCDNQSGRQIEVLFAKGSGGFGESGCSLIAESTEGSGSPILFFLLGIPVLLLLRIRQRLSA